MAKLTKKQKLFVEEYLIDLNATQAAIRAGYSPDTAAEIGRQNLIKLEIKNRIDKAMAERSKRTGVNADRVVRELAKIAFYKASDVINFENATLRADATDDDLAVVQSVKIKTIPTQNGDGEEREIKLADKIKALELLGKHLGMYIDKSKVEIEPSKKFADICSQLGGEGLSE